MVRVYKKKEKHHKELTVLKAIEEIEGGQSINKTAQKYGISRTLIKSRMKENAGLRTRMKQGRKTVFPVETEKKIATAVKKMAELGFWPTLQELRFIVQDFVNVNDIATPFTDGMPEYEWTVKFMDRRNLGLKKGGLMQLARKSVTSDPFVIYGIYELLEAEVKSLGWRIVQNVRIWNCDETGFPMDPSKFKTIGEKGKKAIRVTCGANKKNITG